MAKIKVLPPNLIDQIAAGEVIENPASVIKELVENSIDAGAKKIFIKIQNVGKDLIQVIDDGEGMSEQDCLLATKRHATSKLQKIDDLYQLNTMGFRGEALCAIASISHLEITTNQNDKSAGFFLQVINGKKTSSSKIGFAKGTKILVKNIFQNIPVRLKFLKSVATELQRIKDRVLCLSLANPEIEFRLLDENKTLLHFLAQANYKNRIEDCLGNYIAKNLFCLSYKESYLSFTGFFSLPEYCRINKKMQFEFINNRYIQSPQINKAIYKGYEGMLMRQLHPIYVLFVKIDPAEVDVNVHPAKTNVQLKNHILVQTIISQQIINHIRQKTKNHQGLSKENLSNTDTIPRIETVRKTNNTLFTPSFSKKKNFSQNSPSPNAPFVEGAMEEEFMQTPVLQPPKKQEEKEFKDFSYIRVIGVYGKYLFAQIGERFAMVDVHAAHERIRYEKIKQEFFQSNKANSVPLLQPLELHFSKTDLDRIIENLSLFEEKGLQLKESSNNSFFVHTLPSFLQKELNQERIIKYFILEVIEEKENFGTVGNFQEFIKDKIQRKSCHSAIRGVREVQSMQQEDLEELLQQICSDEGIIYCPHGRPVILFYQEQDLDKLFKRS